MTFDRLRELVEAVLNGDADSAEAFENGLDVMVALWSPDRLAACADSPATSDMDTIVSSMFGQLHFYGEPGSEPFVRLGQAVEAGQRVALLEAMKTYCPVVTTRACRILEILVEHGAEVAAGQPLFRVA